MAFKTLGHKAVTSDSIPNSKHSNNEQYLNITSEQISV